MRDLQRVRESMYALGRAIDNAEWALDTESHEWKRKFEKCREVLSMFYNDHTYCARSEHLNDALNDPEIQNWMRESG